MLLLAGPPLQGPARSGGWSGEGGTEMIYQEGEQASDGNTGEYSGSSSEEVDAPVFVVGTKRDYTRQRTATPGLRDSGGGADMAVGESPGTAATNQGRKRRTIGWWCRGGGDAAGGAGGGGAVGQQEIGGGGGCSQNDGDRMEIGGRSTSTSAAGTGGQQ